MGKKGEQVRQRIIEAANGLFYRKGYNQTSFAEIAKTCDIPKGNFYHYFKSKDQILEAVIAWRQEGISRMLAEWDEAHSTPQQRLHRYVQILLNEADDILRYGCPMGSLNVELGKAQLALQSRASEMFTLFLHWLEAQFLALGKGEESTSLAMHLLSMAQGTALLSSVYADRTHLEQEVNRILAWLDSL